MKCDCSQCNGTGRVVCADCDGEGKVDGPIECVTFNPDHPRYDELIELQKDAKRCLEQALRLKALQPSRADSYQAQLDAALFVINGQAEKVFKA